jgi:hypothetical protein
MVKNTDLLLLNVLLRYEYELSAELLKNEELSDQEKTAILKFMQDLLVQLNKYLNIAVQESINQEKS